MVEQTRDGLLKLVLCHLFVYCFGIQPRRSRLFPSVRSLGLHIPSRIQGVGGGFGDGGSKGNDALTFIGDWHSFSGLVNQFFGSFE